LPIFVVALVPSEPMVGSALMSWFNIAS